MALFTDGPISSVEDLAAQDSQLLDVASTEGIDLTRKLGLVQDEVAVELEALLARLSSPERTILNSAAPGLANVAVTPPLKLWHTFGTLEAVYRDAYNNQLNDRYAGKRDQFREKAKWAREKVIEAGIGMVFDPVPRAATPELIPAPGGLPDGSYFVTMAWVNGQGQEGAAAEPAVLTTAGSTIEVRAGNPPQTATGWNVYAGLAPDAMTAQNATPIAIGQSWRQPDVLDTAGRAPGTGQVQNYVRPVPRTILRG